jgi:thiol-disulfide isomerase/thioredoxin
MWKRVVWVTVVLAAWAVAKSPANELSVGDAAPKIEVKEFIKGDPVTKLEKGKTYVVEFWATWCGPCRTSIPHLTELQKKYKDVIFIGVSAYENDQAGVKPFVDKMGDQMAYRVALDSVPEGGKRNEGKMAVNWMAAAEQGGIPTAFIINGESKIAWIGHPMQMDKPLKEIVDGTWNLQAAAAEYKQAKFQKQKLQELREKLAKARASGDPKELVAVIDQVITDDPKMEALLGSVKFMTLAGAEETHAKALEYGKQLVDKTYKDDAQHLNALAWSIVDPKGPKPEAKFVKLALAAAQRADEVSHGKDGMIADTLALAYFHDGDAAKALETQERAVKLLKGTPGEKDEGVQQRLEQYRKAVKK